MSRHTNFQFRGERERQEGRVAQMSRQEEVIARKRQEIREKQKTNELAKQVVAAQSSTTTTTTTVPAEVVSPAPSVPVKSIKEKNQTLEIDPPQPKNNFTNDGSFFENFKRITEAAKKAEEEKQKLEAERIAKEKELEEQNERKLNEIQNNAMPLPYVNSIYC